MITQICLYCTQKFEAALSEVNRGNGKFCSYSCCSKHTAKKRTEKIKIPNVTCAYCSIEFYKNKSKQKCSRGGLFFCCRAHKDAAQQIGSRIPIQPPHYQDGASSYRDRALRVLEQKCVHCGYDELPAILEVHHKDANRANGDIENLEMLCPTCHQKHHYLSGTGKYKKM